QKVSPSLSTAIVMFSGLVMVGILRALGSVTGICLITTGTVIKKMISKTSITSTRGVVLMVVFSSASSMSAEWTEIDMPDSSRAGLFLLLVGDEVGLKIAGEAAQAFVEDLVAPHQI